MTPVFTPGGERIAYGIPVTMTDTMRWSTWTVSVFGGKPQLLLSNASALRWVPGASPRGFYSPRWTGIISLEEMIQGNLKKISLATRVYRQWAEAKGLRASETPRSATRALPDRPAIQQEWRPGHR